MRVLSLIIGDNLYLFFNLNHKVVLLCILLQLVAHCPHDVFNLSFKELLERVYRDAGLIPIQLLNLLLIVQNSHDLRVVVPILLSALTIVKVDQHVSQVLVQSGLYIVCTLLGLGALLLVVSLIGAVLLLLVLLLVVLLLLLLLLLLACCILSILVRSTLVVLLLMLVASISSLISCIVLLLL